MQRKVFRVEQMFAGGRAAARPRARGTRSGRRTQGAARARRTARRAPPTPCKRSSASSRSCTTPSPTTSASLPRSSATAKSAAWRARPASSAPRSTAWKRPREKILKSAEVIDDSARALAATLKDDYERGLAQDIQDHVVKIYEACNFQDLSRPAHRQCDRDPDDDRGPGGGHARALQRPAGRMRRAAKPSAGHGLLNGPKLDGDSGHTSQSDIDSVCSVSAAALIRTKQTSAAAAKPAASASAAGSDARSTTNAITSGAAACISRNGPASRPIRRP